MTDITAHSEKWGDLPLLNDDNRVASDDDVESRSDLLYFRGLADAIEDQAAKLAADPIGVHRVQLARLHSATDIDVMAESWPPDMLDPWPHDDAADMLAAWRRGGPVLVPQVRTLTADDLGIAPPRPRWWRRTLHKRTARRLAAALAIAAIVIVGIGYATAPAKADPGVGCETIRWGFLGSQRRTVCDTPRRADGSWTREREVWVPAGWVSGYCSGSYWVSCSQGYYRERGTVAYEAYVVTDATVLQDEPGWLPTGSVVIR